MANIVFEGNTDVILSFPSGYGRTVCYQLPSLIYLKKMTIVIIPLVSRIMVSVDFPTKVMVLKWYNLMRYITQYNQVFN